MSEYTTDEAFDEILSHQQKSVPKITEMEFKRALLPILTYRGDEKPDLSIWLRIAGTWRRPIDVVDDRGKEVLFRVPGLVGNIGEPPVHKDRASAYETIRTAQRKMNVVPKAGDEYLIRNLVPWFQIENRRNDTLRQWNEIFKRYGYDDLILPVADEQSEESEEETSSTSMKPDIVEGYDEL